MKGATHIPGTIALEIWFTASMDNNGNKMFRSAIGGFNRDDVNNYIKTIDQKHSEELEALNGNIAAKENEITDLNNTIASLNEEKSESEARIKEISDRLSEEIEKNNVQGNELGSCKTEISELLEKIDKLQAEAAKASSEIEELLKSLDKEKAENARLADNEKALSDSYQAKLDEKDSRIAQLNEKLDSAISENKSLKNEHDSVSEKLIAASAELSEMKAAEEKRIAEEANIDPEDHNSPAYKLAMYDKISSQLGDILINANRNADEIIANANDEAEHLRMNTEVECEQKRTSCNSEISRIKSETEAEAAYIRERLSTAANDLLTEVSSDLHGNIDNCIREIISCITDIQYDIKSLLTKISNRSEEMNDRVSYYQSCVTDGIDTKLSEMDEKYGIRHFDSDDQSGDGAADTNAENRS